MDDKYAFSQSLKNLIGHIEEVLNTEINVVRQADAPHRGLLLDGYFYDNDRNVVVFQSQQLGVLKDYVCAVNCVMLLLRGAAKHFGDYKVLSFNVESAKVGMEQIYLDTLKDEVTRNLDFWRKKKLMFYLYMLFHESLFDLPWQVIANIYISRKCAVMRNAQVYFQMKESMRDMHELVSFKDYIPRRYFVMNNGMYYARDVLLSQVLSLKKLHPLIHIPEMQKFRNLDVKEMMTHRWRKSYWYDTKLVGDVMNQLLKKILSVDFDKKGSLEHYKEMYDIGVEVTNRWIELMRLKNYYVWETPAHLREAVQNQEMIEKRAREEILGEMSD